MLLIHVLAAVITQSLLDYVQAQVQQSVLVMEWVSVEMRQDREHLPALLGVTVAFLALAQLLRLPTHRARLMEL